MKFRDFGEITGAEWFLGRSQLTYSKSVLPHCVEFMADAANERTSSSDIRSHSENVSKTLIGPLHKGGAARTLHLVCAPEGGRVQICEDGVLKEN